MKEDIYDPVNIEIEALRSLQTKSTRRKNVKIQNSNV